MFLYVVNLYGVFDPRIRTAIEMRGYQQYLRAVCAFVREQAIRNASEKHKVVLCGGVTNPQSNQSEAESVRSYVTYELKKSPGNPLIELWSNDRSINAVQHIYAASQYCHDKLDKLPPNEKLRVVICCDECRVFKTRVLAWKIFGVFSKLVVPREVVGFKRADIHPHSKKKIQFIAGLRYLFFGKYIRRDLGNFDDSL